LEKFLQLASQNLLFDGPKMVSENGVCIKRALIRVFWEFTRTAGTSGE
jgi:hypothetical protein